MERKLTVERQLREEAEKGQKEQKKHTDKPSHMKLVCLIFILTPLCAAKNIGGSVTVELATKPVLFAQDVNLICTIQSLDTFAHMAWIKIPNGETIAINNETSNSLKYQTDLKYESSAVKYKLTIRKFAQSDVNALYRCDAGFLSKYENLQLNKEDYIAMPETNDIDPKISISDGYLQGTIKVNSVYPELYNCKAIFEGEDFTQHMKTAKSSTTKDSIFYKMVLEISHKTVKCKGMINVTCFVGIKRIPLIIQDLNKCSNQMQDQDISRLDIKISLPIIILVILVVVCVVCYRRRCCLYSLCKTQSQHESTQNNEHNLPLK